MPETLQKTKQTFTEAFENLRDREFLVTSKWKEQQTRAKRDGAHDEILIFEHKLIRRLQRDGIPAFAHCVWRTKDMQNALFVQGRSKAGWGHSPHNFGCAVDIVHSVKGWQLTFEEWAVVGHIGKQLAKSAGIRIEWGGDWRFYDPAHWQLADWREKAIQPLTD